MLCIVQEFVLLKYKSWTCDLGHFASKMYHKLRLKSRKHHETTYCCNHVEILSISALNVDFCLKLNEKDFLKTFWLRNKAFYHSFWHPEIMIMLFSRFSQASYAMTNWTSYDKKMTAWHLQHRPVYEQAQPTHCEKQMYSFAKLLRSSAVGFLG